MKELLSGSNFPILLIYLTRPGYLTTLNIEAMKSTNHEAKILIVDDQVANTEMLEGFLDFQGYVNILSITDPRKFNELLHSFQPDLILLDLMMPHINGFQLLEMINQEISTDIFLPILVLTADITLDAKKRALELGASDFLTKPFDLIEVGLRISNLLFTRSLVTELHNQNHLLDERVKERTEELRCKNEELNIAMEKAQASDKLKTAFMQNISHEVRTPLNGILGFSRLLSEPDLAEPDRLSFTSMLNHSTERLINTITDFMDISLIVSDNIQPKLREVKLNPMLVKLKEKFSKLCLVKQLEFNFPFQEELENVTVLTDPEFLRKIIHHLLDNAVKFTKEGSINVGYRLAGNQVEFTINDTGCGIKQERLSAIFESFVQEDVSLVRGYEGSGLGLSIVQGLLDLLGGSIRVESVKGRGSTFIVLIPVGS
jgi:signal transduction histidine kinase